MPLFLKRRAGVAVVEIEGVIGARVRVPVYTRLFDSIAQSTRYRALLLDIDSPGGSASGSEVLYRSLLRVAERKPVVAYVRGLGASGGYYLGCAASRIVAISSRTSGAAATAQATARTAITAIPPPRGISPVWLDRSLGRSKMAWRRSNFRTSQVAANVANNTAALAPMISISRTGA